MSDSPLQNWRNGVRRTPRSVRVTERIAQTFITIGGLGTIAAVALIMVFLLSVVIPLFADGEAERLPAVSLVTTEDPVQVIRAGVDEGRHMGWTLRADGQLQVRRLADGDLLAERNLFPDGAPTSWAFSPDGPEAAFGFADGSVRLGRLEFVTAYLAEELVSADARTLRVGGTTRHEDGIVQLTPSSQYRFDHIVPLFQDPVQVAQASIQLLDYSVTSGGRALGILDGDGALVISSIEERLNMLTDLVEQEVYEKRLTYRQPEGRGPPAFLRLSGVGNTLYLIWRDGQALRFDARDEALSAGLDMGPVETVDMAPDGALIERATFLLGKTTLMIGHADGRVRGWFPTRPAAAFARDGIVTTAGHVFPAQGTAVTGFVPASSTRELAVAYADGMVRLYNVTNETLIAQVQSQTSGPVEAIALAPRLDGLVLFGSQALERWHLDVGHPAASIASLFDKVWYEGGWKSTHSWQSEGGSDDFEPKLGLMSLVFGTLKAALYSMLIAGPIAILAAMFTSEFLTPTWRAPLKSVIEMMASLPSVVLGFLAAIVLAPFVENVLMTVLCTALALPLAILLGARLWQLLPQPLLLRMAGTPRLVAIAMMLPASLLLGAFLAPHAEAWFFAGDIKDWLAGRIGTAVGGWSFLLLPVGVFVAAIVFARVGGPWLRRASSQWSHGRCALADLLRLGVVLTGGVVISLLFANLMAGGFGVDPRDSLVGPYEPRNAMIVGFVMGFAIVPIIYTLAEDALSSVPDQLREGSLGCGASPWQTAWRIVLPTAMSGVFSALMMGLGRAVGETMIVLMAAGNTPLMEWNVFNGFRTLSANIATELPEAVQGSTHYRVLFLAGLVLFLITFAINSVAEVVRRHFRKRFADL